MSIDTWSVKEIVVTVNQEKQAGRSRKAQADAGLGNLSPEATQTQRKTYGLLLAMTTPYYRVTQDSKRKSGIVSDK